MSILLQERSANRPGKPRFGAAKFAALLGCGLALLGGGALAQDALAQGVSTASAGQIAGRANVVPQLSAFKVTGGAGGEKLVAADRISPGEVIEYQVRYANTGGGSAKNLQAILPIPSSLQFVPGSASPAGALASLNGKSYAAMPLKRLVKAADGTEKTELVPASEYRFLRWNVAALGAGQSVKVAARAQLAPLASTK